MGKKAVEMGRYGASELMRNKNLQKKAVNYGISKLTPFIQDSVGSAMDQLSTKVRPNKNYKTNRPELDRRRGRGVDIHKHIGKLPKPKGGWTLPGHKYTGPYNDLENQVRYNPETGEILEIYEQPTGATDAVAMQHDVDYSICGDDRKCKNKADRKMVKSLDAIPWKERQWGHTLARTIDVFSKYGWIKGLKDKKTETVSKAFEDIFKSKRKPQKLWTDKGSEFISKHFKDFLKSKGISLYHTENEEKSSVVERWNKTMKNRMWKMFTVNNNTVYWDKLDKLVNDYNNARHSSIKMSPVEASKKKK